MSDYSLAGDVGYLSPSNVIKTVTLPPMQVDKTLVIHSRFQPITVLSNTLAVVVEEGETRAFQARYDAATHQSIWVDVSDDYSMLLVPSGENIVLGAPYSAPAGITWRRLSPDDLPSGEDEAFLRGWRR